MTPARVFVVAPTPTLRAGLRSMLAAVESTDLIVVGEGGASGPGRRPSEADVVLKNLGSVLCQHEATVKHSTVLDTLIRKSISGSLHDFDDGLVLIEA